MECSAAAEADANRVARSGREIGPALRLSPDTVTCRWWRARQRLRRELAGYAHG